MAAIADYKDILAHQERINQIIYDELMEIQNKFGDERRTELQVGDISNIEDEDLIEEEDIIVTLTHNGYVKRLPVDEFKAQNRGGRGVKGWASTVTTSSSTWSLVPLTTSCSSSPTPGRSLP